MEMKNRTRTGSGIAEVRAPERIAGHAERCDEKRQHTDKVFNQKSLNRPPFGNLSIFPAVMHISKEGAKRLPPPSDSVERKYIVDLFKNCYDAGDFLSQLPVPRDGAFVIFHMRPNLRKTL
ncbi:uncharacterized protein LOC117192078 isoform X2 [Drosophila miranda]|uniref:uncharacterized protein LOC117192078 isoform X2 n=1 Tax=Drosophila miranda TaxID=7229 RepID=UPI00143F5A0A|nr:uncharacterized protein LOC117192078 isoform X2 [Drosophila miranda]